MVLELSIIMNKNPVLIGKKGYKGVEDYEKKVIIYL